MNVAKATESVKITARSLGLIGLLGSLGGAIDAWLCYAKIPTQVVNISVFGDLPDPHWDFSWFVIPAGAGHGALLAITSVGLAVFLWRYPWFIRWLGLPIVWWLTGWISFIPFGLYGFDGSGDQFTVLKTSLWPVALALETEEGWQGWAAWAGIVPLWAGSVGLVYYVVLNICRGLTAKRLSVHLEFGSISACLGSLVWWVAWRPWYLSLIHGAIWGSLVGYGVWRAQQGVEKVHHL